MELRRTTLEKLALGDHEAFHLVFKMFYAKVLRFASGMLKNHADAEDVAQIVFFKLWLKREKLTGIKNLDTYIYTIAKNTVLNYITSRKYTYVDLSENHAINAPKDSPVEQIEAQDLKLLIDMTVSNMPPQRQKIYRLSREQGLTNEEIANQMGLKKKTVENHLNLALRDIRNILKLLILLF